jgi:MFS family permease
MFEYYKSWMEVWFFALMLIGLAISLFAPSAFVSYLIALISGFFAGRLIYERKHKVSLPYIVLMAGYAIGYIIGAYYANRWVVFFLSILGAIISYELYNRKILKDTRF